MLNRNLHRSIGTEKQSEELVRYLMQDFEDDPLSIWNSDIFGRSLSSIVREGIQAKLSLMPENARYKLKETLERIINEGIWRINCDYFIRKKCL